MATIDIFNGDADGICALMQLRLAVPKDSRLVTGVKRDIALVEKADIQAGDDVTILDISMEKNATALRAALDHGARCFYVDHHFAGDIHDSPNLTALIDMAPDICTSLLVNNHLQGAHAEWAVVGAFGDNLQASAQALSRSLSIEQTQQALLEKLGRYINYNGYGASVEDLHFAPAALYRLLASYHTPLGFIEEDRQTFDHLEHGYLDDMALAQALSPEFTAPGSAVYMLPDEGWARRVSGVYSNALANAHPDRAHAVLTRLPGENFLVSVRAPLNNKGGADEVCRQFPSGGGRKAAAGINKLPAAAVQQFFDVFSAFYR